MKEGENLIYSFIENGLYYENQLKNEVGKTVSLTIDTLQINIDYLTGNILSVTGFLPLFKANKNSIVIPQVVAEKFCVSMKNVEYQKGIAYDYFKFFPESERNFIRNGLPILEYDNENKRILIGTRDDINDKYIKVDKNIICGIDSAKNLKALLISLDIIIQ